MLRSYTREEIVMLMLFTFEIYVVLMFYGGAGPCQKLVASHAGGESMELPPAHVFTEQRLTMN